MSPVAGGSNPPSRTTDDSTLSLHSRKRVDPVVFLGSSLTHSDGVFVAIPTPVAWDETIGYLICTQSSLVELLDSHHSNSFRQQVRLAVIPRVHMS